MSLEIFSASVDRIEAELNPVTLVTPTNKREVKSAFLSTGELERFEYRSAPDPEPIRSEIDALRGELASIPVELRGSCASILDALEDKLSLASARGTQRMALVSRRLYGSLRPSSIAAATALLARTSDPPRPASLVDAAQVKRGLEAALERYGLSDWRVLLDDREITAVIHSERLIALPERKLFAPDHASRLAVHEVGVHVLRAENGGSQPFSLLGVGLPGFYETEEGLAVYSEVALGTVSMFTLRQYALRVLAVRDVLEGLSMEDSCRRFRDELDLTDTQAFDVAFRAFRGGGLVKDHIYFQGFLLVRSFARSGRLADLYVGKVGVQDLGFVRSLRVSGWVREPSLLPAPMPEWNSLVENL